MAEDLTRETNLRSWTRQGVSVDQIFAARDDAIAALQTILTLLGEVGEGEIGGTAPDATTLVKGLVKLAGDLSGTADNPVVTGVQGVTGSTTDPTPGQIWTAVTGSTAQWANPQALNFTLALVPAGYLHLQPCPGGIQPDRPTNRSDIHVGWMMVDVPSIAPNKALPDVDFHLRIAV